MFKECNPRESLTKKRKKLNVGEYQKNEERREV